MAFDDTPVPDYVPPADGTSTNTLVDPNSPQGADPATQQQNSYQAPQFDPNSYATTIQALENASSSGVPSFWGSEASTSVHTPSSSSATVDPSDFIGRLKAAWKDATAFGNENKNNPLLQMGLSGIAAAQKNQFTREQSAQQQQYALDRMEKEAQIARDKIAANSASIVGTPRVKGIIAGQLTRLGGRPVFNPNGTMA